MPKPSGSVRTAVPENRFGSWPFSTCVSARGKPRKVGSGYGWVFATYIKSTGRSLPHVTGLLHLLEINILPDAFWRTENTMF